MPQFHRNDRRRESGAAMFVAVLMLVLMGALGLAAMDTVRRDRQVAGFQNRTRSAFYAAEAGASHGRSIVNSAAVSVQSDTPPLPNTNLGDAVMYNYESQLPQYYGDPAAAGGNPIVYAGQAAGGGGHAIGAKQKFSNTLWRLNVTGQSPNALAGAVGMEGRGSTSRVEVVASKLLGKSGPGQL